MQYEPLEAQLGIIGPFCFENSEGDVILNTS